MPQGDGVRFILSGKPAERLPLLIYSVKGELAARLYFTGPGVSWTAQRSGVYFCRLRGSASKRFIVIR